MTTITWLHLSDFHWRETWSYEENVVLSDLLRDLRERASFAPELKRVDFIAITGDLAFAACPQEYVLAARFLDQLRDTLQVPKERLFVIPGNHDIDRSVISADAQELLNRLENSTAITELLGDDLKRAIMLQRLRQYQRFVADYWDNAIPFDSVRYFFVRSLRLAGKQVAVLGLNSAWGAYGSDTDRGRLVLGERQVRDALQSADRADIRVALMHHPLEWLRACDREQCEPLLLDKCHFILQGHLHENDILNRPLIRAAASYESRSARNGYNLVQLDLTAGMGTIYLRMWSNREGGFWTADHLTSRLAPGKWMFPLPSSWRIKPSAHSSARRDRRVKAPPPTTTARARQTSRGARRVESAEQASVLDLWWQAHEYSRNPVPEALLDADGIDLRRLQSWLPIGVPVDPASLWSERERRLVLVFGAPGSGKTFYRRLLRQELVDRKCSGALEITYHDYASVISRGALNTRQIANCFRDKILKYQVFIKASSLGTVASSTEITPTAVLADCGNLAAAINPNADYPKLYLLVDDLGKCYDKVTDTRRRAAAVESLIEFFADIAKGAAGEALGIYFFLPLDLYQPIAAEFGRNLPEHTARFVLDWTEQSCIQVVERRLELVWIGEPSVGAHLPRLLHPRALVEFEGDLKAHRDKNALSPRKALKLLFDVTAAAAKEPARKLPAGAGGMPDPLIPVDVYRRAVPTAPGRRLTQERRRGVS